MNSHSNTTLLQSEIATEETSAKTEPIALGDRRYLSPDGLAAILGVSLRTIARWHDARIGPPRIKVGNTVLYDLERLNHWLEENETSPIDGNTIQSPNRRQVSKMVRNGA